MKYMTFFCFMLHLSLYSQENKLKEYIFLDKYIEADLNYTTINSINGYDAGLSMLDSVFNVTEGEYFVFRFLNYEKDVFFDEYWFTGFMDMYNLVILKTDEKNKIIDGYWYCLTNPDMPLKCFLYRVSQKNVKLTHNLDIEKLKFKRESIIFQDKDMCDVIPLFLEGMGEKGRLIWHDGK